MIVDKRPLSIEDIFPDRANTGVGSITLAPAGSPQTMVPPPGAILSATQQGALSREQTEGRKDDGGKCRMELIPPELMVAVGTILTFGAAKYEDRNWERGMNWGRVFGALMRHLWAWWGGKGPTMENFALGEIDGETGQSHLWHAACCIAFLIAYESRGSGTDDRFVG